MGGNVFHHFLPDLDIIIWKILNGIHTVIYHVVLGFKKKNTGQPYFTNELKHHIAQAAALSQIGGVRTAAAG